MIWVQMNGSIQNYEPKENNGNQTKALASELLFRNETMQHKP